MEGKSRVGCGQGLQAWSSLVSIRDIFNLAEHTPHDCLSPAGVIDCLSEHVAQFRDQSAEQDVDELWLVLSELVEDRDMNPRARPLVDNMRVVVQNQVHCLKCNEHLCNHHNQHPRTLQITLGPNTDEEQVLLSLESLISEAFPMAEEMTCNAQCHTCMEMQTQVKIMHTIQSVPNHLCIQLVQLNGLGHMCHLAQPLCQPHHQLG